MRRSPRHRTFNCSNCAQSTRLANQNLRHLCTTSALTRYAACPHSLLPSGPPHSGRLSTLRASARCKSHICILHLVQLRAPIARTQQRVLSSTAHCCPVLLQTGFAPLGFETKCCAPRRMVRHSPEPRQGNSNNPKEKNVTMHTYHQIYPLHCVGGPIKQH